MKAFKILFMFLIISMLAVSLASCDFVMSLIPGDILGGNDPVDPGHTHTLTKVDEQPASCTESGVAAYYTCSGCEKIFADAEGQHEIASPEKINALGHSFTDYKSNDDATYQKDGTKTAKCDNCDETHTAVDEGSMKKNLLTEEEYMSQVACYGTTNTMQGDGALKRGRIIITIPMLPGTKVTMVGDQSVYKFSVIRTNNPFISASKIGDIYQVDPGWNTTWADPTTFVLPELAEGKAPEYIVIVFARIDGAKLSETEIQNLHTLVKVEGNKAIFTDYEGVLTEEEYERQAAHYGSVTSTYKNKDTRMRISFAIRMQAGTIVNFIGDSSIYKWAVVETADTSIITKILDSGWNESWADPTAPYVSEINGAYLVLTVAKKDNSSLTAEELGAIHDMFTVSGTKFSENGTPIAKGEQTISSIAHRGLSAVAPENTLSAYRYAYLAGFKYVECDVTFTKDGYPVLLHDSTIDRTSNGSGSIADMTLAEARSYEYGSWKDMSFMGEAIPTFEEFIALCAELGLHPYIEIKGTITDAEAKVLYDIVAKYDYLDDCSWISFDAPALNAILKYDDTARLGYVCNSVSSTVIDTALAMQTGKNEVFIDLKASAANANAVTLCQNAGFDIEVWTVNAVADALALNGYVSGVTSDWLYAGDVID